MATVALQQGRHVAEVIRADVAGLARTPFQFRDKGQMAAIGRRRAVMQRGRLHSAGVFAWLAWLLVHIYFLSGFRSRLLVVMKWGWSDLTFARGSRLIQSQGWRSYPDPPRAEAEAEPAPMGGWAPSSRPPASGLREVEEESPGVRQSAVSLAP